MLMTVVLLYTICWLPLNLYLMLSKESISRHNVLYFFLHWLAVSSSCHNPYIYCFELWDWSSEGHHGNPEDAAGWNQLPEREHHQLSSIPPPTQLTALLGGIPILEWPNSHGSNISTSYPVSLTSQRWKFLFSTPQCLELKLPRRQQISILKILEIGCNQNT